MSAICRMAIEEDREAMRPVLWAVSAASLVFGVLLFLVPTLVTKLNDALCRNLAAVDQPMMRLRYLVGLLLLISGYLFFVLGLG